MPRKQKAKESSESVSLPDVAAMKFWDRLKNPPPVLACAFPEDPDFKPAPLRPLLSLPSVSPDESAVYSLYIALDELISHNVCIWRRVHVKSIDLEVLHHTIQLCFGWEDMHLHQFNILKTCVPSAEEGEAVSERTISIAQLHAAKVKKFIYTYDFGDDWRHTITIEKKIVAQPAIKYPYCVDGDGANAVEDCGGIYRWAQLLEELESPDQQRKSVLMSFRERMGSRFLPRPFNCDATNRILRKAFHKRGS